MRSRAEALSREGLATVGINFTCKYCLPGLSGALRKCLPQVYPKFAPFSFWRAQGLKFQISIQDLSLNPETQLKLLKPRRLTAKQHTPKANTPAKWT